MIQLTLRKDFVDLDKYAEALGENLQKGINEGLKAIGRHLRDVIRTDLDKRSAGSTRVVRYNPKRKRWASPEGSSPNSDTKALKRSISFKLMTKGGRTESVFVGTTLDYGEYLEKGTSKMKPRPYLEINAKREKSNLEDIMNGKIQQYLIRMS